MRIYDDALPVDEEWAQEHDGQDWAFTVAFPLYDLIEYDGIDAMNEACDTIVGVVLTGLGFEVIHDHAPDAADEQNVLVRVMGTVSADG